MLQKIFHFVVSELRFYLVDTEPHYEAYPGAKAYSFTCRTEEPLNSLGGVMQLTQLFFF
jgi:hypothetical protein